MFPDSLKSGMTEKLKRALFHSPYTEQALSGIMFTEKEKIALEIMHIITFAKNRKALLHSYLVSILHHHLQLYSVVIIPTLVRKNCH